MATLPVFGQRIHFATPVENSPTQTTPIQVQPIANGSGWTAPGPVPPGEMAPPSLPASPTYPANPSAPPALLNNSPSPTYVQPGTMPAAPAATLPGAVPAAPPSAFEPQPGVGVPGGTLAAPPANWDPYAPPGGQPSALMQQDPYFQSQNFGMGGMQKVIQHIDLYYDWFAGNKGQELGINDMGIGVTVALPMFFNSDTPLLVTPGFGLHLWNGPVSVPPVLPSMIPPADLPPRTYDAYLDTAWNPQVTPWLGGELNFRIGVYSDFKRVNMQSLRYTGKGMFVVNFSPSFRLKGGVWYLDRVKIKMLPAGGVCWNPNPDIYFDILFPNPEIAKKLTVWGNTEWWLYARGDYGGGTWMIQRDSGLGVPSDGTYDIFDYNDIRVAVGLRFKTLRQFNGFFEVGGAFHRQLIYRSGSPREWDPNNTVYIGGGVAY
jgi:hypothetical protein